MTTTPKKSVAVKKTAGRQRLDDGTVRVWSTVGATIPIPDSFGNIKFSFGHERIARSDSQESISKTEALIDEFNEKTLEKRLNKYFRMYRRIENESGDADDSVKARAKKRLKKSKKGKK